MVDNLPLIPSKEGVCADVRPLLRQVFRELDYLPPSATQEILKPEPGEDAECSLPRLDDWVDKYKTECKQLWLREGELKQNRARTISRKPASNKYKLYQRDSKDVPVPDWRKNHGILERKDLIPSIERSAGGETSLWVKNILNRSSCDSSSVKLRVSRVRPPVQLLPADDFTLQSLSIGETYEHLPTTLTLLPEETPQPQYIVCVPPRLDFINFTIGQLHSQSIRLVNVSKFEVRLSIRPPERRELDLELGGTRGLTVTSGAAAELKVHFRPQDVRVLRDHVLVRVSAGRDFIVPIACYMQPPILEILVPSITSSTLSCTPGDTATCAMMPRSSDLLELGARLLGDVHYVRLLLHCDAPHAEFFVLTEDDWLGYCLNDVRCDGSVVSGWFSWWPARWAGGGGVRGAVACRAREPGLHAAALRLLASTAVARPLHLLADALLFTPQHITIEAQEKDYDICSEDDPACEYFVHLGTAFPGRSLTATVQLINHSPVLYSYYWSVRPWGECSCAAGSVASAGGAAEEDASADTDSDHLCATAREHRLSASKVGGSVGESASESAAVAAARRVRVSPGEGAAAPRSARVLHVAAPHVGTTLGVSRAVLMLVLKDIPKESFPADYDPMIVSSKIIDCEPIPGFQRSSRSVCDVVCCQLEVWWEVAPLRFVLDPPVLPLMHSKRVQQVEVVIRATQLFGCEAVRGSWRVLPSGAVAPPAPAPPAPRLTPATSCATRLTLALPPLAHKRRETDVIALVAENDEWASACCVWRQSAARHVALRPALVWLGLVPPGEHISTALRLHNNTYQQAEWRYRAFRWVGESCPSAACARRAPCPRCHERACSCALLRPAGDTTLPHGAEATLHYDVNAPERDGCVCTLVRAWSSQRGAGGTCARSTAVAYRVLAPAIMLRVLPCRGDQQQECEGCRLDEGAARSSRGTAILRPARALTIWRRTCCRLKLTNTTPLHTTAKWEPAIDGDDILNVTFIPTHIEIASYAEVEIKVVLEPRKVCGRRVFVYRASVDKAYKPLYLVIDTAIAGVEVVCEIPLGAGLNPEETVCIRRTQKEKPSGEEAESKPLTPAEIFLEEDRRRDRQKVHKCRCPFEMVYIPPVVRPEPPEPPQLHPEDYEPSVEILDEPPPLTRVCPCCRFVKPLLPEREEPICLQFRDLPLRTVRSRRLVLRNESVLTARWSCSVRRWPRVHSRTLDTDQWSGDVREPGVALQCAPARGSLAARRAQHVLVSVYAATWGVYRDQILIQIENMEPIVLDVWVEAMGAPLHFAIKPNAKEQEPIDADPVMWMSQEETRTLQARNTSCATLTARAYLLNQHQDSRERLPFRVYLRLYDVPARSCPCLSAYDSDYSLGGSSAPQSSEPEMDTAVELYLTADYGLQQDTYFKVEPAECVLEEGARVQWRVSLPRADEPAPPAALLLRLIPHQRTGVCWQRPEPPPQLVVLQESARVALLQASRDRLCVRVCALRLPQGELLRVRKRLQLKNVRCGALRVCARTQAPWSVLAAAPRACPCDDHPAPPQRHHALDLVLPPRSSTEICVEVRIRAEDACPVHARVNADAGIGQNADATSECILNRRSESIRRFRYETLRRSTTPLRFYDAHNLLLQIPLTLELEFPALAVKPDYIDFGFVTDGDSRKTYFTVSHSSRTETLELAAAWEGGEHFQLWPREMRLAPRDQARVYVQYTARWCGAPVEGVVRVWCVRGGAGCGGEEMSWCSACVRCRAAPTRDYNCRATVHDHTDDTHLLPASLLR